MELFNYIAGTASILSLIISVFTLHNVVKIINRIDESNTKAKQSIDAGNIKGSNLTQIAGRDRSG